MCIYFHLSVSLYFSTPLVIFTTPRRKGLWFYYKSIKQLITTTSLLLSANNNVNVINTLMSYFAILIIQYSYNWWATVFINRFTNDVIFNRWRCCDSVTWSGRVCSINNHECINTQLQQLQRRASYTQRAIDHKRTKPRPNTLYITLDSRGYWL